MLVELDLGPEPEQLTVVLYPGVAWWTTLVASLPFAAGDTVSLVFDDGTVWLATISPDKTQASFYAVAADVTARALGGPQSVWLRYVDASGREMPWAVGSTVVKGGTP